MAHDKHAASVTQAYLMLPENVAFVIPVHSSILHYDIVEHDSTTAVAVDQAPTLNLAVLPVTRHPVLSLQTPT